MANQYPVPTVIANFLIFGLIVATSIVGLVCIYDGSYDAGSLDVSLSGVSAKADDISAATFAAGGALAGETDAVAAWGDGTDGRMQHNRNNDAGTNAYTATALKDDLEAILKARIKLQYALKESPLVWQAETGTNGKRTKLHEPENSIDFQFDKLNDGWAGCSTQTTTVFSPFASLSPADVDFVGRCDGDERLHGDDMDSCDDSWMAKLYDPETKPLGITVHDRWSSDTCDHQKKTWPWTSAMLIIAFAAQLIYYLYWGMNTSLGTDADKLNSDDNKKMALKILCVVIVLSTAAALGLFGQSYHKLLNGDYKNGVQDATTVSFDDDVAIADFPARAKMYHDAFKMCYKDEASVLAHSDGTGPAAANNGCASWTDFQTAITSLGLADASNCAFGADKDTYETPIDACNLPASFERYTVKSDGPQLEISDGRKADISGTQTTLPLISMGTHPKGSYGFIIAGLVIWLFKELLVAFELFGGRAVFCSCLDDSTKYAIAGGYAGAV